MSSGYPWYSKLADVAHRTTVLGLIGFTVYMSANVGYTLYVTGKENERRLLAQKELQLQQDQAKDADASN